MLKKRLLIVLGVLFVTPILLFLGWKLYNGIVMFQLRSITVDVQPYEKIVTETNYDVIVVGGEPEGVAAAVSAARNGAKTLLIEHRDGLGGLMTYGMLNFIDYDYDMHGNIANAGIFKEWHEMVGGKVVFDIDTAKDAFLKLVQDEPNITLSLNTRLQDVIVEHDELKAVIVEDEHGEHTYYAQRFIDTTQDADLAYLAGAPYFIGGKDIGLEDRKMAVTLMIHLDGVNWDRLALAAVTRKFGPAKINPVAAWGFVELHHTYTPTEPDTRLRGLNIARQSDGTVYINALHIFGVDGLDEQSKQEAIERGKRETEHIVAFLREEFPGFERAEIASFPTELYVRETRHIYAEYQLPITDVWENRDHWDSIGFGSYPVDIQATSIHDYGFILTDPTQYAIPFRSLVPLKIDGLLVASKASGYSSLAAGSARIIPTGMTTAEAAGAAATLSLEHDVTFREMSKNVELIKSLQTRLVEQGANLYPYQLDYAYEGKWYYPAIQTLLSYGLISGGHDNDLQIEQLMTELQFVNLLINGVQRANPDVYPTYEQALIELYIMAEKEATPISYDRLSSFFLHLFGHSREGDTWQKAIELGLIDEEALHRMTEDEGVTRKIGYQLLAHVLNLISEE
jgi:hypothetical protein